MNNISRKSNDSDISEWKSPQLVNLQQSETKPGKDDDSKLKNSYDEAFQQGYEAGKELGIKEQSEQIQILKELLDTLSKPFNDQNDQLTEYISLLAGKIAKSLVRRELHTEPETLLTLIRETVAALNTSEQEIRIHLNPKNASVIRSLVNSESEEQSWKIVDDPLISISDCKVTSNDSIVDADLDTRIDLIINQMLGDERNAP